LALSLRSLRSLRLKAQGGGGSNRRTGVSRHASLVRHVGSAVDCGSAARDRVPWQATCLHAAHTSRPRAYRRQRLPACTPRILRLFAANGLEAVSLVTSFDPMAATKPIAAKRRKIRRPATDNPKAPPVFFVSSCLRVSLARAQSILQEATETTEEIRYPPSRPLLPLVKKIGYSDIPFKRSNLASHKATKPRRKQAIRACR
jgi:hypothetical protein